VTSNNIHVSSDNKQV